MKLSDMTPLQRKINTFLNDLGRDCRKIERRHEWKVFKLDTVDKHCLCHMVKGTAHLTEGRPVTFYITWVPHDVSSMWKIKDTMRTACAELETLGYHVVQPDDYNMGILIKYDWWK